MINMGERLKYIRETYDVTQNDLGKFLHVSKYSICHYEKNDRDIPMRKLSLISDYFDLSIDYILGITSLKKYDDLKKGLSLGKAKERIKKICEEQSLTNVGLAKILNTSESCIRKYKTGQTLILTSFALELYYKYNYSLDWLLGKTEYKKVQEKKHVFN